ncbi:MAG TPA: hypothetical protein PKE49_14135 [Leptospiraceae bacterium]|nr:hypothetical protein [Leptospirales bacterium]HMU82733.1 hypothetical protein [Leptospiraceae bacterium]HMW59114.1 hypothetical protein [Leptospiraceae bacterium]HMX57661.1 hypothetical protein [Leptospiraceae bacterium]HMY45446.1 hypothetical protein [Leptospiraceae bacterium]
MRFFLMIATMAGGIGAYRYWSTGEVSHTFGSISIACFTIAVIPPLANKLFLIWMKLAHGLQFIVLRTLLSIAYILAVVPIGLIARVAGKKFLETIPDRDAETYWENRAQGLNIDPQKYEHHF